MEDRDLIDLLKDLESDRAERKSSIADTEKIRQAICAFANDLPDHRKPGIVFIGINDDGSCASLIINDRLLLTIADMRSDGNILPLPSMTVQKRVLEGCEVAVIIVQPSDAPPVRLRGRIWIRVGPRRAIATPDEERRLTEKRRARDLPFDIRPFVSSNLEDLDLDLFRRGYLPLVLSTEVLEENQRSLEQQLSSVRFAILGTETIPTVLGILVLGKDPRQFLPGSYIQFLRIDGTQLTDPIKDRKEVDGPLQDLLRMLDETLRINISVATDITRGPIEVRHPDYPTAALQQLSINAVLHRNYEGTNAPVRIYWFSDRIEILSPGGPFGQVSRENFGKPGVTDYRNPHLAEVMRNLGYVQRFGVGIQIARRELERNGNPPPEFIVEDTHVMAIIRRRT